nr:hypothetical protein [uncultured Halomonas sp.]
MLHVHVPSTHTFASLMASLELESVQPLEDARQESYAPLDRMRDANHKLQEATARLKACNIRMERHLAELRNCVDRLREIHPG